MEVLKSVEELNTWTSERKSRGQKICCVPTMGYLHAGHGSLIKIGSKFDCEVVTTVFVNPTQFGPNEDFEKYPRDFDLDYRVAKENGSKALFIPDLREVYPPDFLTYVNVDGISDILEGYHRPGHFKGVATVVTKLLLMTKADKAVFGQKDYQQSLIIRALVRDLNVPCKIIIAPIIREKDGLAMSSRNVYLQPDERVKASGISKSLFVVGQLVEGGEYKRERIEKFLEQSLFSNDIDKIDYAVARLEKDLSSPDEFYSGDEVVLLVTAKIGKLRLLDNIIIKLP